jgi:hypothetical protein
VEQTKLERLLLLEVSGVGDEYGGGPAHQSPGWMVTKAKGPPGSDVDHSREAALVNMANAIRAEILHLQRMLELVEDGSLDMDATTKARVIARRDALVAEFVRKERHAVRDKTGKFAATVEHEDGTITTPLGRHYNAHPMLREALRQSK